MTTLAAPIKGIAESTATDHAECGKLAAQSIVQIQHPSASLDIPDNATAGQIISAIRAKYPDLEVQAGSGNAADLVAQFIPQGVYVLALVYCTGLAVPCPPPGSATHWIAVYGDSLAMPYYQCWTASYQTLENLRACSESGTGYHVLIRPKKQLQGAAVQFQGTTKVLHDAFINKAGHFVHRYRDVSGGDIWHMEDLGAPNGVTLSEPSVAMDAAVTVQVVRALGSDGHVWVRYAVLPGGWGAWVTDPEADAQGDGASPASGIDLATAQRVAHDAVVKALNAGAAGA